VVNATGAAVKSAAVILYAKNGASKVAAATCYGTGNVDYDSAKITISGTAAAVLVRYTTAPTKSVTVDISNYCT
jgi:hypothetical protein